jgi:hypothetical protein
MRSGEAVFLVLRQTLLQESLQAAWLLASPALPVASLPRAQVARLASVAPPHGQRVARRAWQLRVERMQVLQAPWSEAQKAVPRAELEPPAWPRRELVQPQPAG